MSSSSEASLTFYRNLGKLFYAIAASDGAVKKEEIAALKKLVRMHWLEVDQVNDNNGEDIAYQIETVFDWLVMEADFEVDRCWEDFKNYKRKYPQLFTDRIKELIYDTANKIANSFARKNKSEIIILTKLRMELY